jgi:hypothetical protein
METRGADRVLTGYAISTLVAFISVFAETSAATEVNDTTGSGFYFGAAASRVEHDVRGEKSIIVATPAFALTLFPSEVDSDDTDAGWSATLGYRINRFLSAEIAYHDFGAASVSERYIENLLFFDLDTTVRVASEASGPAASLLVTAPVTQSLELLARGGVLFLDRELTRTIETFRQHERSDDAIWMIGVGAHWNFSSRWTARLEYQVTDRIGDTQYRQLSPGTLKLEQLSLALLFRL